MGSHKISVLSFVCFVVVAIFYPSNAQNSAQDFLNAHNEARAAVGVPPLTWDDTVAAFAQNFANQRINDCSLVHSGGPYGELIAVTTGTVSGEEEVRVHWVDDEKPIFDFNPYCQLEDCGRYTQVVWRNSVRLGCARVQCRNKAGWWFVICNYDPPGNIAGQRPY